MRETIVDLILWRHADAEEGGADLERRLSAKGRRQAKRAAAWLRKRLREDANVLVSPARRAIETADALTDHYRIVPQLDTGACASDILAAAGWPRGEGTVVVVGHQPTLGRAAALVLTGTEAEWRIKKGAVWWFRRGMEEGSVEVVLRAVMSPELL